MRLSDFKNDFSSISAEPAEGSAIFILLDFAQLIFKLNLVLYCFNSIIKTCKQDIGSDTKKDYLQKHLLHGFPVESTIPLTLDWLSLSSEMVQ